MDYTFEAYLQYKPSDSISTEGFKETLRKIGGGIVKAIQTIWKIITEAFKKVVSGVRNFFTNIINKSKDKKAIKKVKTSSGKEATIYKDNDGKYTVDMKGQGTITKDDIKDVLNNININIDKTAIKEADDKFDEVVKHIQDIDKNEMENLRQLSSKLKHQQTSHNNETQGAEKDQTPTKDLMKQLNDLEGKELDNAQKVLDEKNVDKILTDLDNAIKRSATAAKVYITKYNSGFSTLQKTMSEISKCTDKSSAFKIWASYSGNVYDDRVKEKENKKGELDLIRVGYGQEFGIKNKGDRDVFYDLAPSITLLCTDHPEFVPKFQNKLNGMLAAANKMYKDLDQYKKNIENLGSIADNAKCEESKTYSKMLMEPSFEVFDDMCKHFSWMINNINRCINASNKY